MKIGEACPYRMDPAIGSGDDRSTMTGKDYELSCLDLCQISLIMRFEIEELR